jgi:hypothetical protein
MGGQCRVWRRVRQGWGLPAFPVGITLRNLPFEVRPLLAHRGSWKMNNFLAPLRLHDELMT